MVASSRRGTVLLLPGTSTIPHRWVAQADIYKGRKPGVTNEEHDELVQLRKENRALREERDILERAKAFFAKETW